MIKQTTLSPATGGRVVFASTLLALALAPPAALADGSPGGFRADLSLGYATIHDGDLATANRRSLESGETTVSASPATSKSARGAIEGTLSIG